jgi:zinc-binding alcohol dehydrogenase/oxidoreductase
MLALQQDAINQPAVVREIPAPAPAAGEVLIKLRAAALNHRDVWIQKGQYAGIKLPCTLGADGSGEVAALGEGVTDVAVGDAVIIYPGLVWGDGQVAQSRDFRVLGMPDPGVFAEYHTTPAQRTSIGRRRRRCRWRASRPTGRPSAGRSCSPASGCS